MAQSVNLSKDQLAALDSLIAKGADITVPSKAPAETDCWFDCVVNAVTVVTMVVGCAGAQEKGTALPNGEEWYTLAQLKDVRSRAVAS